MITSVNLWSHATYRNVFDLNLYSNHILVKFSSDFGKKERTGWLWTQGCGQTPYCRYFARLRSLKNAVSLSKVPKIILWGAGCVGAQYIFRKYLKLLHYSHFYFAFNTHDIWKLFFCQKYVNKKLATFLGFPRNQKVGVKISHRFHVIFQNWWKQQ